MQLRDLELARHVESGGIKRHQCSSLVWRVSIRTSSPVAMGCPEHPFQSRHIHPPTILVFACGACHWIRTSDIAARCSLTLTSEGRTAAVDPATTDDRPYGYVSTAAYYHVVRFSGKKRPFSKSDPGGMLDGALALYPRDLVFRGQWLS